MNTTKKSLLLCLLCTFLTITTTVTSFEYQVGGAKGWVVPPSNDTRIYNDWASENRFLIGDTVSKKLPCSLMFSILIHFLFFFFPLSFLGFRYKKDSVMEVSMEDYKNCNSSHPSYFSNTGDTVYELDHSGPYYFISGVSGHCGKGQRMIIKVLTTDQDAGKGNGNGNGTAPPSSGGEADGHHKSGSAVTLPLGGVSSSIVAFGLAGLAAASMF
ncbi:unnamed protein product [Linum tenue]|uniref:Phytocyanin domain-containing protein n=1 Tax=Linum tenue TaxID=586396 RepID=A0AAV0NDI8_9ROSI|nr:unnamed protein product [Linum tenue]